MAGPYYQGASGNDNNDGLSWSGRFATIQKLLDTINAGETGYIQGETVSAQIDVDMNGGANASATGLTPITIIGCDSNGNALAGDSKAVINTLTDALPRILYITVAAKYFEWWNIEINGGGSGKANYGIETVDADGIDGHIWTKCRFTNCNSHGIRYRTNSYWYFNLCEFDNNGKGSAGSGLYSTNTTRSPVFLIGCKIHHNSSHGAVQGSPVTLFENCLIYRNGGSGLSFTGTQVRPVICSSVFFSNSESGITISSANIMIPCLLINNIFKANGLYGINTRSSNPNLFKHLLGFNCSYQNTSGHIDINEGSFFGSNNVYADPLFVSETDGSEDFRLQSNSPCINTGLGYNG